MALNDLFNDNYADLDTANSSAVAAMVEDMFATVYGIAAGDIPAGYVDWWVDQVQSGSIAANEIVQSSLGFVEAGQLGAEEQANATIIQAAAQASQNAATSGASLDAVREAAQQAADDARAEAGQNGSDTGDGAADSGGVVGGGGGTPTYTLEQALAIGLAELPNSFNINNEKFENTFDSLQKAADKGTAAYDILKKAADGVDDNALIQRFQELFVYTVDTDGVTKNVEITVDEALAAFYATNTNEIVKKLGGFTLKDKMTNFFEVYDQEGERTDIIEEDIKEMIGKAANVVVTDALTAGQAAALEALEALEPGADFTYTVKDAIENVFKSVDDSTTSVETIAEFACDVTLTGGLLDLSPAKVESNTNGATLDLSDMTIGDNVTVKLAELNDQGNKGDLSGDRKSNQTVELPALDQINGDIDLVNMTISADNDSIVQNDVLVFNNTKTDVESAIQSISVSEGATGLGGGEDVNYLTLTVELNGGNSIIFTNVINAASATFSDGSSTIDLATIAKGDGLLPEDASAALVGILEASGTFEFANGAA